MNDLSRESRALLAAARQHERTSDADRARIRSKLSRRLATGLAMGTAVTASATVAEAAHVGAWVTAVAWLPGAAKIISVVAIAGAVSVGTVHWVQSGSISVAAKSQVTSPNPETRAAPANKSVIASAPLALPAALAAAPEVIAPQQQVTPAVQQAHAALPKRASAEANPPAALPEGEPHPVANAPVNSSDSLSSQVAAIREARADIRSGHAPAALAVLNRQFPAGQASSLEPEATLARIAALCALGDATAAHQVAAQFLARFPGSALGSRIRSSCAYTDDAAH